MNILTFDIEDWYNHDDYSRDFNWDKFEVRIYEGVDKILSALEERGGAERDILLPGLDG